MVMRDPMQDAFLARLTKQLEPAMQRVGELLQRRIERSLRSTTSRAGGPPAIQSGDLKGSFATTTKRYPESVVTTVASSDPAALHVELGTEHARARPFMRPALASVRKGLAGQLAAQLRRALR